MKTITVLKAIDYSVAQAGVCFLDLEIPEPGQVGVGSERWAPARIYNIQNLHSAHREYYTETIHGIAFFDTEAQLNRWYQVG